MLIDFIENGLHMVVEKSATNGTLLLLHLSPEPFNPASLPEAESRRRRFTMVEVQRSGEDQDDHHGAKHTASNPGGTAGVPVYISHQDSRNQYGRRLEFIQSAGEMIITSSYQFYDGIPVIRSETTLENTGNESIPLEYVSSFALTGLTKNTSIPWDECTIIHLPFNSWTTESQWRSFKLPELGLTRMGSCGFSLQRIAAANTGSYAAKEMLPMGCFENTAAGQVYGWQIETHSSWAWEISDIADQLYLQLSGPAERENQWFKQLKPGEKFVSVPVAVAILKGDTTDAFRTLHQYRRRIRRSHADNRELPVVFNDYMNCLFADPTTEKLLPLIDRAATLGAEYYVIDAGWYADGPWWDSVGEWQPSTARFPNGLQEVIDHIVAKGMRPGLWLELERMGKNCQLASEWPDECFFCRHGQRVIEHNSLQLDFRHPTVRRHADTVIDRLTGTMGVKFIKMDYNIEIGPGTEIAADSFGDGLLQHERAYLDWLDGVLERYPELVIENCASGGMRNTYSLLSRLTLCSTTDNTSYLANARISINSAAAYCMEQAGVWAYPLAEASDEEVIMNMVSSMSWRPYLSGQIWALSEEKLDLMREGVRVYKERIRPLIPHAQPIWPLGLAAQHDTWCAFGLQTDSKIILSVWHFDGGPEEIAIPLTGLNIRGIACIYPASRPPVFQWLADQEAAVVSIPCRTSRIFELTYIQ